MLEMSPYREKGLCECDPVMDLETGRVSWIPSGPRCHHECPDKWEAEGAVTVTHEEAAMKEAGSGRGDTELPAEAKWRARSQGVLVATRSWERQARPRRL